MEVPPRIELGSPVSKTDVINQYTMGPPRLLRVLIINFNFLILKSTTAHWAFVRISGQLDKTGVTNAVSISTSSLNNLIA